MIRAGFSPFEIMSHAMCLKMARSKTDLAIKDKEEVKKVKNDFPAIDIFKILNYRNKIIMVTLSDANLADTYVSKFKEGSGVLVEKALIYDNSFNQNNLRHACRALASSVLVNRTKVLLLINPNRTLKKSEVVKIAAAFNASLIWLNDMELSEMMEVMDNLNRQLPMKLTPSMTNTVSVSTIYQNSGSNHNSSFDNLRQYTKYQRSLITAFASLVTHCMYQANTSNVVEVVGYNPEYVDAGLLHNTRIKYIEIDQYSGGLILPPLNSSLKSTKRDDSKWMLPDSQRKLNQIDSLMLSLGTSIIYIGSYPCTHLQNYNLSDWNIVFIDPKIDDANRSMLLKVCPNAKFESQEFVFNHTFLDSIVYTYGISGDVIIIDDSYNDMSMSYSNFQEVKLSFFEEAVSDDFSSKRSYKIKYVAMKCNIHMNRKMKYVVALLPQPLGGDLDEMRLILGHGGIDYNYEYTKKIKPYMEKFKELELPDKLQMIKYYHALLTTNKDALRHIPEPDVTIALYSITNVSNSYEDIRKYLIKMHAARKTVIVNAPYAGRIKYMLSNGYKPGLNIKMANEKVVFDSPSKRTWSDHCINNSEMLDMGYIQITCEMLSGLMGLHYKGPGFLEHSSYSDLFNIYVPSFIADTFFRYQHVGIGPISVVKSITSCIRNITPCIARGEYYKLRGKLVEDYILSHGVADDSYVLIGTEMCAIRIVNNMQFETPYGNVFIQASMKDPVDINISGHLLSLTISSHFVPVALDAWIMQLRTMSKAKNVDSVMQYMNASEVLMFDNRVSSDGKSFLPWHTMNELILTLCILDKYVSLIMRGNYSQIIINDVRKSFIKMETLSI